MKRLIAKDEWYLFDPKQIKIKFKVDLNNIFGKEFSEQYNKIIQYIKNYM
jgi:hypothetical protein